MAGWDDELVLIQQNEDGSYTYEIRELGIVRKHTSLEEARSGLIGTLEQRKADERHPARLAKIQARMEHINAEIEQLHGEYDSLANEADKLIDQGEIIQATELLEQIPQLDRNLRLFTIDHAIEQHIGAQVVCIGFILAGDKDKDGDMELAPMLHFSYKIGTK